MDSNRRAAIHGESFGQRFYWDVETQMNPLPLAIEAAKALTETLRKSGFKVSRRRDVVTITGEPRKSISKKPRKQRVKR